MRRLSFVGSEALVHALFDAELAGSEAELHILRSKVVEQPEGFGVNLHRAAEAALHIHNRRDVAVIRIILHSVFLLVVVFCVTCWFFQLQRLALLLRLPFGSLFSGLIAAEKFSLQKNFIYLFLSQLTLQLPFSSPKIFLVRESP